MDGACFFLQLKRLTRLCKIRYTSGYAAGELAAPCTINPLYDGVISCRGPGVA